MSETEKKFDKSSAKPILGAISAETAFVQPDYPYGRRLRCERRCWVETNPRYGMRFMTQTTNPKRPGRVWNKPDNRTYSDLVALWVDDKGFVATDSLTNVGFYEVKQLKEWGERNQALLAADEYVRTRYTAALTSREAYEARKAEGEVKLVVTKAEWVPGQGMASAGHSVVRSVEEVAVE